MRLCSRDFRDLTEISSRILGSCLGKRISPPCQDIGRQTKVLYDFKPTSLLLHVIVIIWVPSLYGCLIHFDLGEKNESMGPFLTIDLRFLAGEDVGPGDAASRFKEGFFSASLSLVDNKLVVAFVGCP